MCDKQYQASETSFVYSFAFLSFLFNTGAKPVFPDKSEKDKPKFAIKGQKQSSKYPYQLCLQTKFKFVFKYTVFPWKSVRGERQCTFSSLLKGGERALIGRRVPIILLLWFCCSWSLKSCEKSGNRNRFCFYPYYL